MEFRILGSLEVSHHEQAISVGGPRQRTALAMLLLEPSRVITAERLVSALWDDDPPTTARNQVQICISGLRQRIESADRRQRIVSRRPGYALSLTSGDSLDSQVFDSHLAAARSARTAGDVPEARHRFRAATALWRGSALDGLDSRVVQQGVAQLNERRLLVLEECFDCELGIGMYSELACELVGLVEDNPLRERFHAQLMLALYGAQRQAEALDVYRRARETLVGELGIEPGPELRQLHQEILTGAAVRTLIRAPSIEMRSAAPPDDYHVPRMLIADIPDFTGRSTVVERIVADVISSSEVAEEQHAVPIYVIHGRGGVGKTTLAVHIAHKLAAHFQDGQLFARLRHNDHPTDPADVLERFLRAVGVSSSALPEDLEERAAMYRDRLAQRRMLVVLDDAMSEQQVTSLLPGSAMCSVIVTSRKRLTGVAAANRIDLGDFSHSSAVELLTRIVGAERIASQPDTVATLCRLCGYLPLALRIVGARLAARQHWSVFDLVERLVDESRRLDELKHGSMGMRASILLSYESLSPGARTLFRRLALLNAPSFGSWVGAPLLEASVEAAQDYLEELTDAYLLDAEADSQLTRYRFHDIMRPFALERLARDETAQDRRGALERWLGALLYLAREAHRREYSGSFLLLESGASGWPLPGPLVDRILKNPLEWYEQERPAIVSAVRQAAASGMVEFAWDLAQSAVALFESHCHFTDWRETHETALKAVIRAGDRRGEAVMRYSLGSLHMFRQRPEQAVREFTRAYRLFVAQGDQYGVALVRRNQAVLDRRSGNLEQALTRWEQALVTFRAAGDLIAEAHILHNMAQVKLDDGDEAEARALLSRAKRICTDTGNRRVGAQVLYRLGELHLTCGETEAAAGAFADVLAAVRESGDQIGECYALLGLGIVRLRRNELRAAEETLAAADRIASVIGERMVQGRVVLAQADLMLRKGNLDKAAEYAECAISDFEPIKATVLMAEALLLKGQIDAAVGNPRAALAVWRASLTVLSGLNLRSTRRLVSELKERISNLDGDFDGNDDVELGKQAPPQPPMLPISSDLHAGRATTQTTPLKSVRRAVRKS